MFIWFDSFYIELNKITYPLNYKTLLYVITFYSAMIGARHNNYTQQKILIFKLIYVLHKHSTFLL